MASNYFSEFSEKKQTAGKPMSLRKGGKVSSMREKPAMPGNALPGKTQPRSRNNGIKKLNVYPKSIGL